MSSKETTDEWAKRHKNDKYSATGVLLNNLEANLKAMTELSESEIADLMRMNVIMVRQYAADCGVD